MSAEGMYRWSPHARERLAERFAVAGDLEAERWLQDEMAETHILKIAVKRGWLPVGYRKLLWFTPRAVIVTEGNLVLTCWPREGQERDSEVA